MRIGLLSDTHLPSLMRSLDELGPQLAEFLRSVDLILHSGDVVTPSILDWCEQFAPLMAARGNHDAFDDPRIEKVQVVDVEGYRIVTTHDLRPEDRPIEMIVERDFKGMSPDIVIGGDTHVDRLEYRDGTVLMNSGSPNIPHHKETRLGTVGLLEVTRNRVYAEIILLGQTAGSPNPGTPRHLELYERRLVAATLNGDPLGIPDPVD
ncbi:MAG: metallophosphoesterase family protein [Dehalococcoidia bacterium]|nr:metallophosphoesterase family protein [Dehalococcoidia bacterium]